MRPCISQRPLVLPPFPFCSCSILPAFAGPTSPKWQRRLKAASRRQVLPPCGETVRWVGYIQEGIFHIDHNVISPSIFSNTSCLENGMTCTRWQFQVFCILYFKFLIRLSPHPHPRARRSGFAEAGLPKGRGRFEVHPL